MYRSSGDRDGRLVQLGALAKMAILEFVEVPTAVEAPAPETKPEGDKK